MSELGRSAEPAPLHPISRIHLLELTDGVGIMQHAIGAKPDPAHGYCTDDVARALIVDLLHGAELGWAVVAPTAEVSLTFLTAAFDPSTGRFRNFRDVEGDWLEDVGSEDAHARAVLALGEASATAGDARVCAAAAALFEQALPATLRLTYLRPLACAVVATDAAIRGGSRDAVTALPRLAAALRLLTEPLRRVPSAEWPWPERVLTYEKGLGARALIVAVDRLGDGVMVERGLQLLDWLVAVQTAPDGHFSPIGTDGWWPYAGDRATYDQQPIEATALLLAAEAAFAATGDRRHLLTMEWTYGWFLGRNDGGCAVALPATGGGHDGLTPSGVNLNQGAESTLMWLIALERIRVARRRPRAIAPSADRGTGRSGTHEAAVR